MMRTAGIIALGLVAATVAQDSWQDWEEEFGPQATAMPGNNTPGNGTGNNTNSTTTTATTKTTTITTTSTTLPKADFLNVAFFKDAPAPATTTTTTTTANSTAAVNSLASTVNSLASTNANCAINAAGQRAYFAKLSRTGCNCKAMPPPPQGWASWSKSSDAHNGSQTFYQLTLAAATKDGNPVASFHAFCNADCSDCEVRKTSDNTLPMNATCEIETPLPTPLEYNTCNTADFDRGSFFLRLPVVIDSQGSELCVLEESPAAVEGGISFIEYPANTDCDANGTNPGFRSGAMMVTAVAPITNDVCTANSDGTYYQLKEESGKPGPQENMTIVSGKINCANQPPKTSPADYCLEIYCDKVEGVVLNGMGSGGCLTIDNGDKASLSMRIQGSGSVQKCYMPPAPPKPSTGGKSNTPLIAGAAGGGAVLLIIIVIVVRKRRASRAAAYSVLQGSSYTES